MTDKEILQKAIERASKAGYRFPTESSGIMVLAGNRYQKSVLYRNAVMGTIFSHDFAKAFWGDEDGKDYGYYYDDNGGKVCKICGEVIDSEIDGTPETGSYIINSCPKYGHDDGHEDVDGWAISKWKWHLQQMVISENPIRYLEQFLQK